ncbi:MAG: Ni/Fe hydrogenase subunit alpha [Maritimibacter sp.]
MSDKTIKVDMLARVEGEGAFKVKVKDGKVVGTEFRIFEPPRFFEAFLQGRDNSEVPDITARICGICPVAYQMSSVQAMEMALGITVTQPIKDLRRLLYCGEWIESHVLHVAMLHAPDFLGYPSALEMAQDHPDVVKMALEYKKIGNSIVSTVAGREIHPINARVGGWWKAPSKKALKALREDLLRALDMAEAFVDFTATLPFPDKERDYTMVCIEEPNGLYPIYEGTRVISNRGLNIPVAEYNEHFEESHVARSNALQSHTKESGDAYLTGPLPRYNLAYDKLSDRAKTAAKRAGLGKTCLNPYRSITVRAVESLYAVEEAIRLIDAYEEPDQVYIEHKPRAGTGMGASEAPRGLLFHEYTLKEDGSIAKAQIVPPTAQNQPSIEEDLESFIGDILDRPEEEIQLLCEQTIRNYDPCISCATHFLDLQITRD